MWTLSNRKNFPIDKKASNDKETFWNEDFITVFRRINCLKHMNSLGGGLWTKSVAQ